MDNTVRPTILSVEHIKKAIGDSNFFEKVPEFAPIKKKMDAMHVDFGTGCSPCKKRRVAASLTSDFTSILTSLSDDGLARVKAYMDIPRLLVRTANRQTGRIETREV